MATAVPDPRGILKSHGGIQYFETLNNDGILSDETRGMSTIS